MVALSAAVILTISWTAPTERTDGTPLPYEQIESYTVHGGALPELHYLIAYGEEITVETIPGFQCFIVSTNDVYGLESEYAVYCPDVPADSPPNTPVVCP